MDPTNKTFNGEVQFFVQILQSANDKPLNIVEVFFYVPDVMRCRRAQVCKFSRISIFDSKFYACLVDSAVKFLYSCINKEFWGGTIRGVY